MQPFKEKYLEVEDWYNQQSDSKINDVLQSQNKSLEVKKLYNTISWYININEQDENIKQYLFGEKIITLDDISKYMVNYLESQNYGPKDGEDEDEWTEEERSAGYGGYSCYLEILSFWKELNDNKILSIVEGDVIDLDNGRCYFLSRSNVHPLIFSYVYYNQESFLKKLGAANSKDFSDYLEDFLPPEIFIPNISTFNKIHNTIINNKIQKEIERFNNLLSNVVKQFKNHEIDDLKKRAIELKKYLINEKGA